MKPQRRKYQTPRPIPSDRDSDIYRTRSPIPSDEVDGMYRKILEKNAKKVVKIFAYLSIFSYLCKVIKSAYYTAGRGHPM